MHRGRAVKRGTPTLAKKGEKINDPINLQFKKTGFANGIVQVLHDLRVAYKCRYDVRRINCIASIARTNLLYCVRTYDW